MLGLLLLAVCQAAGCRRIPSGDRSTPIAHRQFARKVPQPASAHVVNSNVAKRNPARIVLTSASTSPDKDDRNRRPENLRVVATTTVTKFEVPAPTQAPESLRLTLRDAVQTGLIQNPDLIAVRTQEGVSLGALGVAETYPWNPFVQSQILPRGTPHDKGNGPGTGAGKFNYYVWVMQRFELAHQQRYREENATAMLNQTRWTIQQAELTNVVVTTQLYFAALYQKQIRDLVRQSEMLNEKLLGVVERRFKAGLAKAADVTTAKVSSRQAKRQTKLAEANYQTALLALRRQLNLPISVKVDFSGSLAELQWLPINNTAQQANSMQLKSDELQSLAAELVEGRPDVMAASAGVCASRANMSLARAAQIPDLQAGPIYETDDAGTKFLGFRVQTNIPVFDSGRPLARQRRAELHRQAVTYAQLKVRATQEAVTAIDRYERARRLVAESRVDLSPLSGKTPPEVEKIITQFQAGQATILTVFLIQNSLIQEQQTHLGLLNELAQASAGVIRATGLPLERLMQSRKKAPVPPEPVP